MFSWLYWLLEAWMYHKPKATNLEFEAAEELDIFWTGDFLD